MNIGMFGGLLSFANIMWFAIELWRRKCPPPSIATWVMWTALDGLLFVTTMLAHQPIWLPLSYVVGATSVTLVLFMRGTWMWSRRETLSAIVTIIATYVWQVHGAGPGIVAGVIAMTAAGMPLFIDMIRNPIKETFPLWIITVVACICTLIASDWSFTGTILAWGGIAFNGTLAVLCLRKKK